MFTIEWIYAKGEPGRGSEAGNVVFPSGLVQHTCMSVSLLNTDHQWPQGDVQALVIVIFSPHQAHIGPRLSFIFCGQHT